MACSALAQEPIYRCGNEYTNTRPDAKASGCTLVQGGNLTVVPAPRASKSTVSRGTADSAGNGAARISGDQQKARDSEARLILQDELKKSEARLQELQQEYNNGEPEKRGDETRNHQKYLDRVAALKASLARTEADIAGLRRELARQPGANASSAN